MRILIITYNREVNPGTFLQGFGVQYAMRKIFPNATVHMIRHKRFYRFIGGSIPQKKDWNFIKGKLAAIPRRLKYEWCNWRYFKFSNEEFDFFDFDHNDFKRFAESYDLIVVGSDTILVDLKKNGKYGLMWLNDIITNKVLFSASAAPANFELTETDIKILRNSFETFRLLSVRDSLTQKLLAEKIGLGDAVYLQADPTYLIPEEHFSLSLTHRLKLKQIKKHHQIVLVNFGESCPFKKRLTIELKEKGFYVISTLYNPDADWNIMTLSPFQWAALFKWLDLTITERFHDSVFTMRNNRPVIAIDWDNNRFSADGFSKTSDLLDMYGLVHNHFVITEDSTSKIMQCVEVLNNEKLEAKIRAKNIEIAKQYETIMKELGSHILADNNITIHFSK